MSFTATTNYALQKPDIGTELDGWGDELNGNWDIVSTQMKLNADAAAAANTALAGKAPTVHTHVMANITDLAAALALKAPLAAPTFTGIPAAPTAAAATNTTQIATTAFVTAALAASPSGSSTITQNAKTANYTLLASDAGKMVTFELGSVLTCTVNTGLFATGQWVDVMQLGGGAVQFAGTAAMHALNTGTKTAGKYSQVRLWFFTGGAEYVVYGNVIP